MNSNVMFPIAKNGFPASSAMKLIITVCIVTAVRTVNDPFLPHTSWRYMSWRIMTLCLACLLREKT
ncbi:hypothetical protein P5673_001582 [Acropora cervicornis]|uniref:Uncharacterized protein n=1 Tax=Acropora cervicornis TaxID=6130 RepID=A0AAD9VH95_ACRCE|nr:hypothetical protein P5673_001582 [Acropora cervicornis]